MWNILLAIRFLLAKRRQGIISFINIISVTGVGVGVAALIIVISVMNGFDNEVRSKIIGTYADLMVIGNGPVKDPDNLRHELLRNDEIMHGASFVTGQAILQKDKVVTGVLLKGIDTDNEPKVTDVMKYIGAAGMALDENTIVLGNELMRNTGIDIGDEVQIIVPHSMVNLKKRNLKVIGGFHSGRYDYDANIAVVDIRTAQEVYEMGDAVTGIALKIVDGSDAETVKKTLSKKYGASIIVKAWSDLDKNLVAALAMEKKMMFVVLGIIIVVACFNICSSLIMMVMEKTKDIGILRSIGANAIGTSAVFFVLSSMIGMTGVVLGGAAGLYIAGKVNEITDWIASATGYDMFPHDIYYFEKIPVLVDHNDVVTIISFALVLSVVSGLYPAFKAAKLDPIEAIRYE